MSVCAKAMNKPFYVVAESFKFTRQFPLNQQDVPNNFKVSVKLWMIGFEFSIKLYVVSLWPLVFAN